MNVNRYTVNDNRSPPPSVLAPTPTVSDDPFKHAKSGTVTLRENTISPPSSSDGTTVYRQNPIDSVRAVRASSQTRPNNTLNRSQSRQSGPLGQSSSLRQSSQSNRSNRISLSPPPPSHSSPLPARDPYHSRQMQATHIEKDVDIRMRTKSEEMKDVIEAIAGPIIVEHFASDITASVRSCNEKLGKSAVMFCRGPFALRSYARNNRLSAFFYGVSSVPNTSGGDALEIRRFQDVFAPITKYPKNVDLVVVRDPPFEGSEYTDIVSDESVSIVAKEMKELRRTIHNRLRPPSPSSPSSPSPSSSSSPSWENRSIDVKQLADRVQEELSKRNIYGGNVKVDVVDASSLRTPSSSSSFSASLSTASTSMSSMGDDVYLDNDTAKKARVCDATNMPRLTPSTSSTSGTWRTGGEKDGSTGHNPLLESDDMCFPLRDRMDESVRLETPVDKHTVIHDLDVLRLGMVMRVKSGDGDVELVPVDFVDVSFVKKGDHMMRDGKGGADTKVDYIKKNISLDESGGGGGSRSIPFPRLEVIAENIVLQLLSISDALRRSPKSPHVERLMMNKIDKHRARLALSLLLMHLEDVRAGKDRGEGGENGKNGSDSSDSVFKKPSKPSGGFFSSFSSSSSSSSSSGQGAHGISEGDDIDGLQRIFMQSLRALSKSHGSFTEGDRQKYSKELIQSIFHRRFSNLSWWETNETAMRDVIDFASTMVEPVIRFLADRYGLTGGVMSGGGKKEKKDKKGRDGGGSESGGGVEKEKGRRAKMETDDAITKEKRGGKRGGRKGESGSSKDDSKGYSEPIKSTSSMKPVQSIRPVKPGKSVKSKKSTNIGDKKNRV